MTITWARRSEYTRKVRASNPAAANGLRYEREFGKILKRSKQIRIEHNPWFEYTTDDVIGIGASSWCSPDYLIWDLDYSDNLIVVEIKYSYVPGAIRKLRDLYIPVVEHALDSKARGLIIVKNLNHGDPKAAASISDALKLDPPVFQWLGKDSPILL